MPKTAPKSKVAPMVLFGVDKDNVLTLKVRGKRIKQIKNVTVVKKIGNSILLKLKNGLTIQQYAQPLVVPDWIE